MVERRSKLSIKLGLPQFSLWGGSPEVPKIRGYTWFQARDDRPFRGAVIYVSSKWAPLVTKIPDIDTEMNMEMIHLRVNLSAAHTKEGCFDWLVRCTLVCRRSSFTS